MLTVKHLAKLAGVTPRTLHHYDAIGLLKPTRVGVNGYRYYGEEALLRLQQILFYRELGMPLEQIRKTMGRRDFDVLQTLQGHRRALTQQVSRLNRLIETVDQTILHLKGNIHMDPKDVFKGFTEEEQARYEEEAMQLYDPETVKASARKWKSYTQAQKQQIGEEGQAVYRDFLAAMPKGPASREAQAAVERWLRHIEYFWKPTEQQMLALAKGYSEDVRFRQNFDKLSPELAPFIRDAVTVYVENRGRKK